MLKYLCKIISSEGPITFKRYMQEALYAPSLGYYRSGLPKFGKDGDFITAPEVSPLFSRSLANQCSQVINELNGGDILEIGAGQGTMAADILLELDAKNSLPDNYYILELSSELKQRQQQTIKDKAASLLEKVSWLSSWPESPISGVVLANEVLDAMPVHLFRYEDQKISEYYVEFKDNKLTLASGEASTAKLIESVTKFGNLPSPYISEVNTDIQPWLQSMHDSLDRGVAILIDYGYPRHEYYHPQRGEGTIMCHIDHIAHADALIYPGVQDITAHVDFTAVAEAAVEVAFHVAGFSTQADFLLNCGLLEFLSEFNDEIEVFEANQAIKMLTLPTEMGELFKVMALTKYLDIDLLAFQRNDQRYRLG